MIQRKPHPKGIKFWTLADKINYMYHVSLFKKVPEASDETVLRMADTLPDQGHTVRADSAFGCPNTAFGLAEMGQNFTLNCQASRKHYLFTRFIHKEVTGNDVAAGAITTEGPTPIAAISFTQQKSSGPKTINFISNVSSSQDENIDGKVAVAVDYRDAMGFVDQADRNAVFAAYPHKHQKWTHATFFWLLKVSIANAWLIWLLLHDDESDILKFTEQLVHEMLNWSAGITDLHDLIPQDDKRDCSVCEKKKKTSKTTLKCTGCGTFMHQRCFELSHEEEVEVQLPMSQQGFSSLYVPLAVEEEISYLPMNLGIRLAKQVLPMGLDPDPKQH